MKTRLIAALLLIGSAGCIEPRSERSDSIAARATARDTVIIDGTMPTCLSCSLELGPPLRLGTTDDDHIPQRVPLMVRDRRGTYYLVFNGWGNKPILRYDSTGRFIGRLGRYGQGPGEYQMTFGLILGPGDSTLMLLGGGRAQVFAPDGSFARTARTHGRDQTFALAPDGSGDTYALTGSGWRSDDPPVYVKRVGADGVPRDSFPIFAPVRFISLQQIEGTERERRFRYTSGATSGLDGSIWTWLEEMYRLERHATDGTSKTVIGVSLPGRRQPAITIAEAESLIIGPPPRAAARRPVNAPPRLSLTHLGSTLQVDSAGRLWVVRPEPAPSYDTIAVKGQFKSPDEAPGEMTIPRDVEDRLYRTFVEVIDAEGPELLARLELPFLGVVVAPGFIGRVTMDESDHYVSTVYRLVFRGP